MSSTINKFNPNKLLNSKWTAVTPKQKEKHFIVVEVERDDEGVVIGCQLEAIMSKRAIEMDWRELKDRGSWLQGWK
ncbi:TIGR02450 family Trp-rich protein [Vibrio sp. 10N]|nr:TIGR02450 family Trp-rich protein [Vibrio sp. 10N]